LVFRLGFFLFAMGWALSNMTHAFVTGWHGLAVFRAALGASEAAAIPAGAKVTSEWFPAHERPLATGCFQMGTSIGSMAPPPLVAFCILWWNWQAAFLVTGGLSVVWALLWWLCYRSPAGRGALSDHGRALIDIKPLTAALALRLASKLVVLRSRSFWAIAIPRFLAEPAWQTFNFFIPLYLASVWKLDLAAIAS
jgi:ACS family hexuronate transporter-like MFS transporter